jgi:FemAB family
MVSIFTRNVPFFKRQEIWFYDNSMIKLEGNNLFIHALNIPENLKPENIHKVYTTSIKLLDTVEILKLNLKTKLRGYISKGEKTLFEHKILDISNSIIQKNILIEYNYFAKLKNISLLNKAILSAYCNSGNLVATQVFFENKPLISHIYLHDHARVSLLYSYHLQNIENFDGQFRSLSNRYLHWLDILYFKQKNFTTYDFGGISSQTSSLRDFKTSFGGVIEEQYGFTISTGLYRLLMKLKSIFRK